VIGHAATETYDGPHHLLADPNPSQNGRVKFEVSADRAADDRKLLPQATTIHG
jgi:hypothetical protein